MLRWKNRCRIIMSATTTICGIIAFVLLIYGAVQASNLSLSQAKQDKLDSFLQQYISCSDRTNDLPRLNDGTDGDYQTVFKKECRDSQAYLVLFPVFTAIVLLVATIGGLISLNSYIPETSFVWFCVFGGVTAALAVGSIGFTNLTAHHAVSRLVPCDGYSNATVTRIHQLGLYCISGSFSINGGGDNKTALTFIEHIVLIYAGATLALVCVLFFLFMQPCSRSVIEDLEDDDDFDPTASHTLRYH